MKNKTPSKSDKINQTFSITKALLRELKKWILESSFLGKTTFSANVKIIKSYRWINPTSISYLIWNYIS